MACCIEAPMVIVPLCCRSTAHDTLPSVRLCALAEASVRLPCIQRIACEKDLLKRAPWLLARQGQVNILQYAFAYQRAPTRLCRRSEEGRQRAPFQPYVKRQTLAPFSLTLVHKISNGRLASRQHRSTSTRAGNRTHLEFATKLLLFSG